MTKALAQVLEKLEAIRSELVALRQAPPRVKRPHRNDEKQLFSKAAAARFLGCDLKTTFADMIAEKKIKTVPGPRGARVPRAELERIRDHGFPGAAPRPRPPAATPSSLATPADTPARIGKIEIP